MSSQSELLNVSQVPPALALGQMINGYWMSRAIYVAAKLGMADSLVQGPRSCEELAVLANVDSGALYRILRALASMGIFAETKERTFELTPSAMPLRAGVSGSLRSLILLTGEEWSWRSWGELLYSVKTGKPAFPHLYGMKSFEYFAQNPPLAKVFNEAMTELGDQVTAAVLEAYDFSGIGKVVDLGGGQGSFLAALLLAYPDMRGVLLELPYVIEEARGVILGEGVADRCELVAGDFFESVPAGADMYVIKNVIHDWNDERVIAVLRSCRDSMAKDGRLLTIDIVIPPGNEPFYGKLLDLAMLVLEGGRERTEAEFRTLLEAAGFKLSKVVPTGSAYSVIEGIPA